jgi:signal transduction histidine kinase
MRLFGRFRSLHIHVLLWLIIPFTVILTVALGTVIYASQNNMTELVLERHQQLANLAAVTVSQGIEGNAHVLEALRDRVALRNPSEKVRESSLLQSADALVNFTAGVVQVDDQGVVITSMPDMPLERWKALPNQPFLKQLSVSTNPIFSNVITVQDDLEVILIAVPMFDNGGGFSGAIIGGIDISSPGNSINTAIQKLTTSTPGIAYLIDESGVVISHPDPTEIGRIYSDRPYISQAVSGTKGGRLWKSPEGERYVGAEALVTPSGWSVVIKEPWDAITASTREYTFFILIFVLLALVAFFLLSWIGTRSLTAPIQKLSKSTRLLASDETIPTMEESKIKEIDELRSAFVHMAMRISSYRDGLRHYVEAITRSQEEERLRIARELHDETVQNLLAVYRRMELFTTSETDLNKHKQLCVLQDMIGQTLQGVRLISQDLRPMILDDLGFVPAVQKLVRTAHEGQGAVPHVSLDVHGEVTPLPSAVELALYRIAQEAIHNVRKHAHATSIQVNIDYQPGSVGLVIADDGNGFVVPSSFTELVQAGNLGLMGIQERAWAVGGTLNVESHTGQGTRIKILVPLN